MITHLNFTCKEGCGINSTVRNDFPSNYLKGGGAMAVDLGRLAVDSRRMSIQLEQFTDRYTEALGLSAAQAYLLLYILHHSDPGTSLTQMHREFGFAKPSLCGMLKRLQKNGFIQV